MAEHQAGWVSRPLNLVLPDVIVAKVGIVDPLGVVHDNRETPHCLLGFRSAD